ncbi:MAG: type II toxin-antitoxin system prevent-host-death family antitoxin [Euzebya sp.]
MPDEGIRSLKQNASAVVARAAAGEVVTITDRGRPVALLTPIPASRLQTILAAGWARPPKTRLADLSPPEPGGGLPLSRVLVRMREDERA